MLVFSGDTKRNEKRRRGVTDDKRWRDQETANRKGQLLLEEGVVKVGVPHAAAAFFGPHTTQRLPTTQRAGATGRSAELKCEGRDLVPGSPGLGHLVEDPRLGLREGK